MRNLKKLLSIILPTLGGILMFYGALAGKTTSHLLMIMSLGFAIVLIGAWRLYEPLFPSQRTFIPLRNETDRFLDLVRQLNTTACLLQELSLPESRQNFENIKSKMHTAVDQMAFVAGVSTNGRQNNHRERASRQ